MCILSKSISLIPQISVAITDFGYPVKSLWFTQSKSILNYFILQSFHYESTRWSEIMKSTFVNLVNSCVFFVCLFFYPCSINLLFQLYLRKWFDMLSASMYNTQFKIFWYSTTLNYSKLNTAWQLLAGSEMYVVQSNLY